MIVHFNHELSLGLADNIVLSDFAYSSDLIAVLLDPLAFTVIMDYCTDGDMMFTLLRITKKRNKRIINNHSIDRCDSFSQRNDLRSKRTFNCTNRYFNS